MTTQEIAAAAAAAGSGEKVGLALRGRRVSSGPRLSGGDDGWGLGGEETRGERTSLAGRARGERVPRCPIRKASVKKDVGTS